MPSSEPQKRISAHNLLEEGHNGNVLIDGGMSLIMMVVHSIDKISFYNNDRRQLKYQLVTTQYGMCLPEPTPSVAFVTVPGDDDSHAQISRTSWSNSATTAFSTRTAYFTRRLTPPDLQLHLNIDPRTAKAVWRDVIFLLLGCLALSIVSYVETHAPDAQKRLSPVTQAVSLNPYGIVDTGYILTQPLYEWLREHRDWNDLLAAVNSMVLVIPSLYILHVTIWRGDYSLSFRIISVQLLRSFCGWFTYLPPDPTYLNSYFDFPDIAHCLYQECQGHIPEAMPFVSFFSGHVASMAVVGNHMWLSGRYKFAIFIHVLNGLQILRLLATRGHYSIDIIIGWFVAVYVSNPAGTLGRYYSRGTTVQEIMPRTTQEAFEHVTGVTHSRNESRMAALLQLPEVQDMLRSIQENESEEHSEGGSETTARILQEAASQLMFARAQMIQEKMNYLQQQAYIVLERGQQQRIRFQEQRLIKKESMKKERSE